MLKYHALNKAEAALLPSANSERAINLNFIWVYIAACFCAPHFLCNNYWEVFCIAKQDLMINDQIRDKEVRLIGPGGEQLGIVPIAKAQATADSKNLDLVKIAPQAKPPVCKIMDYGKHKFELSKREKENRKNQKVVAVKEVRLSPNIDDHDFNTKLKAALKFLKNGDKVKVSVRFRGREITHSSLGRDILMRFKEGAAEYGDVDKGLKMEGRNMAMFITPKKK